jgi:hypothetical protein
MSDTQNEPLAGLRPEKWHWLGSRCQSCHDAFDFETIAEPIAWQNRSPVDDFGNEIRPFAGWLQLRNETA